MELALDEAGHVKVQDGKPLYRHSDGKEIPFDAASTVAAITRLNGEAKSHREKHEAASAALKAFEGLDPAAARKALEITANLDAKKLVDAGEVDRVKAEAVKAWEEKFAPVVKERDDLKNTLISEKIGGAFAKSKFIAEKLAIPADFAQAKFGSAFKVEGNSVIAYDEHGNKLFSRERPGEFATFDEALSMMVEQHPSRDQIIKGTRASGSGARGSGGAGGKSLTRAAFTALAPAQQMAAVKSGVTVTE